MFHSLIKPIFLIVRGTNMIMKPLYIVAILGLFIIPIPSLLYAADIEYALKIRKSNPEYGHKIPEQLCTNKRQHPCAMLTDIMIKPVVNIENTKKNLSNAAWSALKRNASAGQEIWEYNLCQSLWNKQAPCVPINGYVVLRRHNVVFYTFFKN